MTEAAPVSQSGSRVRHERRRRLDGFRRRRADPRDVRVVAFEEESEK